MNLTGLVMPLSLDARQAVRLRRVGVAALSYALGTALTAVAWAFGVLPATTMFEAAAAFIAINLGLYAAIRSGFNLRFKDPSLTRFQILAAITVLMFVVYHMDAGRSIALFCCFIVFLFGVFRLEGRDFALVTLYTLAAYALVIDLLMYLRPDAIRDVSVEWMSWLGLAGFLPCFALIGGQVNAIRRRMRMNETVLRDTAEQLHLFADNVPAMTAYWDAELRCGFASRAFGELYGLAAGEAVGRHARELMGEEAYPDFETNFAQAMLGNPVTYQRSCKLRHGECRYLEFRLLPRVGDQQKVVGCFAVTIDITEHKRAEERIQRVAHHDSITGLPNRILFNDRLVQAMSLARRNARQFALLYLDLDKFKKVNDALGHAAGDELLRGVAARVREQVRESDTVARIGGDEFAVILPDIGRREEAAVVAAKIVAALILPFRVGGGRQSVEIGTSIGIAIYPADARDAEALVKAADAAMYAAKQSGNTYRFSAAQLQRPEGVGPPHM